jgi:hypothetical protein
MSEIWKELLDLERRERAHRKECLVPHEAWKEEHYWPALREIQSRCEHYWEKRWPPYGPEEYYFVCLKCEARREP